MALKYGDISKFVRDNGDVKAIAKKGTLTLLKNGEVDSVAFFEREAVVFKHKGKSYTRNQFENLVRSHLDEKD